MINKYPDGNSFLKDNSLFLLENKYTSAFFFIDAPLLKESNERNYALKIIEDEKKMVALKVEPYNVLLLGDIECLEELLIYLLNSDLEYSGFYCVQEIGERLVKLSKNILKKEYHQLIGMDFMIAKEISEQSSDEVSVPSSDDVDELYECFVNFIRDCGLTDEVKKEKIAKEISSYRIIRKDNKIVSLTRRSPDTNTSIRISAVYTRPEYRGQGLARRVVNYLKNEIISEGKSATLNVDQANPISNHLYKSLGFTKLFSQGIYLPVIEK